MTGPFTATATITVHKDAASVWNALTDPAIIQRYFFGTKTFTDWRKGSPIVFRGEWEGKTYEDNGTILDIRPGKRIQYSYWSSMSGTPDIPENYATITYELNDAGPSTELTIMQQGIATAEQKEHSEKNWTMVMEALKKIVEET